MEAKEQILVAEEDAVAGGELQQALGGLGYQTEVVTSAGEALRCAVKNPPSLVLMNIDLGRNAGGVEAAAMLRARLGVPVVYLITSVTSAATIGRARATSPAGYVQKPVSGAILRATLQLVFQQVAEARQRRPQLEFSNRMAALGVLATGLVQEIKSPLSFVMANVRYASEELPKNPALVAAEGETRVAFRRVEEALHEADVGAARISQAISGLLSFAAAPGGATAAPFDPAAALRWAVGLATPSIRPRARLLAEIGDLPPVRGDEARLRQVFLNLLLNALQALPPGEATEQQVRVVARVDAEGWGVIEVSDTGEGIPATAAARLFEPFFTTRPEGQGAGLGLTISRDIVVSMGGELTAANEGLRGATFRVRLPAAPGAPRPRSGAVPRPGGVPRRVLIIDDEPMILRLVRRVLADEHHVTTLDEAEKAIALLDEGARFDVIICDLMMPGMSGIEFHTILSRTHPDQADRVVFISGGATTTKSAAFLALFPDRQLEKPFNHAALKALIATMMQAKDPPV